MLIFKRPDNGDQKNFGMYIAQVILSNACLGFCKTLLHLLRGQKNSTWKGMSRSDTCHHF